MSIDIFVFLLPFMVYPERAPSCFSPLREKVAGAYNRLPQRSWRRAQLSVYPSSNLDCRTL